jgi:hypothetical protein
MQRPIPGSFQQAVSSAKGVVYPEDFLAEGLGTADDTGPLTNWLAHIVAKGVPGRARSGAIYKTTSGLVINTSANPVSVDIDFCGATIKPTSSSANFIALAVLGGGYTATTLASNAGNGAHSVVVTSAASFAVGRGVIFIWTHNAGTHNAVYQHLARITGVSGTTISFDSPLPMAITTSEMTAIGPISLTTDVSMRNLIIDGTNVSGTASNGLLPANLHSCVFENLKFRNWAPTDGVALYPQNVARTTFRNIDLRDCGNNQGPDFYGYVMTDCEISGLFSSGSRTFGPLIVNGNFNVCSNVRVEGPVGRAFKTASCLFSTFVNIVVNNSTAPGGTGLAVSGATRDCSYTNVVTLGSLDSGQGIWLSGEDNQGNTFVNCHASGNTAYEVATSTSDTGNTFIGLRVGDPTKINDLGGSTFIGSNDNLQTYTPAITQTSGTPTTVSATGRYRRQGKLVYVEILVTVTNAGTAAGNILATLPVAAHANVQATLPGFEFNVTGKMQKGQISAYLDLTRVVISAYDNSTPWNNGAVVGVSGTYAIA